MGYSTGMLDKWVTILNRKEARTSAFGLDGGGIEWQKVDGAWANVAGAKGLKALNAGAIDVYLMRQVRMRYTPYLTDRSRIKYDGKTFQVVEGTVNADQRANTIQFLMQLIIND